MTIAKARNQCQCVFDIPVPCLLLTSVHLIKSSLEGHVKMEDVAVAKKHTNATVCAMLVAWIRTSLLDELDTESRRVTRNSTSTRYARLIASICTCGSRWNSAYRPSFFALCGYAPAALLSRNEANDNQDSGNDAPIVAWPSFSHRRSSKSFRILWYIPIALFHARSYDF